MPKFVFVTGGVVSGVGKGITVASIGRILKSRGLTVAVQKLDPYLNVDPGTMNPYQHGEVFVTEDGGETDLDLGHYERFIDENLTRASNVTTGQVYSSIIAKERRGDFLGGTIQVIPHITNEIKDRIHRVARQSGAQVVIVEVGGTVGDIESLPFLESIRQLARDLGPGNSLSIHVTLIPYIQSTDELKTKPTQHSVKELRGIGIQPDVIVCRADQTISDDLKDKIALFCDVERRGVVGLPTLESIYEVPLSLEAEGLGDFVVDKLGLDAHDGSLTEWRALVEQIKRPKPLLKIGVVGKYVEHLDAYISVREALRHAAVHLGYDLDLCWVDSEGLEGEDPEDVLGDMAGIVVPGGFGYRGVEGKVVAARWARRGLVPYLGLCLGMQVMVVELARDLLDSAEANSTEFNLFTPHPVIDLLPEQRDIGDKGGTMRLGTYACRLVEGTRARDAYGDSVIYERHRHRFEFNNEYRDRLQAGGMVFSGLSPDGRLVEISEIRDHPWMVGSQFHPEFKSRPNHPHPLFVGFLRACADRVELPGLHPFQREPAGLEPVSVDD